MVESSTRIDNQHRNTINTTLEPPRVSQILIFGNIHQVNYLSPGNIRDNEPLHALAARRAQCSGEADEGEARGRRMDGIMGENCGDK